MYVYLSNPTINRKQCLSQYIVQTGPYQCRCCDTSYATKEHRDNHENFRHKNDVIRPEMAYPTKLCAHCGVSFLDGASYRNHLLWSHGDDTKSETPAKKSRNEGVPVANSSGHDFDQLKNSISDLIEVIFQ